MCVLCVLLCFLFFVAIYVYTYIDIYTYYKHTYSALILVCLTWLETEEGKWHRAGILVGDCFLNPCLTKVYLLLQRSLPL